MNNIRHPVDQLRQKIGSAQKATGKIVRLSASGVEKTWNRLRDRRVCLGVTGFSGSGKSTFLTSIIHQLMHFPQATLPAFSPVLQERILGVELHLNGSDEGPDFDYASGIHSLSSHPASWPQATSDLSSVVLEIRYKPKKRLIDLPGRRFNRLFVEIRDYPGEWLLDLPMLELSFIDWCHESSALYATSPRSELLGEFGQSILAIDPFDVVDEEKIRGISKFHIAFLHRCRESGLSLIQPGQFLLAGRAGDAGNCFFPFLSLPPPDDERYRSAPQNCYYRVFESRYRSYAENRIKPFYQHSFSGIDRQIILVDLLGALNNGKACFEDLRTSLSQVLDSFQYGHNSLLARLFRPRIDKVVFAASKIDQVLPEQHENVRALMASLVYEVYRKARYQQVDSYCEAIASVRATSTRRYKNANHLVGVDSSGEVGLMRHPDIPDHVPDDSEWLAFDEWQLRKLNPPQGLRLEHGEGLPHIRLDTVMRELLGDKFQ